MAVEEIGNHVPSVEFGKELKADGSSINSHRREVNGFVDLDMVGSTIARMVPTKSCGIDKVSEITIIKAIKAIILFLTILQLPQHRLFPNSLEGCTSGTNS